MRKEIRFFRNLFNKDLKSAIIFITTNCNFRCKHCFYWKSLGKGDLKFDEWKRIIKKLPDSLKNVSLSGGEPFLRKDLSKIISELRKKGIKSIGIPSNGSLEYIPKKTEEILKNNPKIAFLVIISLDGLEKTNDEIRMKGGFKKAVKTIKELNKLKRNYCNLKTQVTTTITDLNYKELPKLVDFVKGLGVNTHAFDIIRGEHQGILKLIPLKELEKINKLRVETYKHYNQKKNPLYEYYSNSKIKKICGTQKNVLVGGNWDYPCTAGKTNIVVEVNGDLRICELQPPIGNLLKSSFEELITSDKAKKIFRQIKNHQCDCTHICFVSSSLDHAPLAVLRMLFGM